MPVIPPQTPSFDINQFLSRLTSEPGVYRMLDAQGTVLYVGKAHNLKKRVSSYFSKQDISVKTRSLISQVVSIEVSVTRSETEALLLESNLIKALRPKYNILMRDDKSYPFLYLSDTHPFPRLEIKRFKKKPKEGICFGPYPSGYAVRETLNLIQKVFKIRDCNDNYFNNRTRPCLQYQIKRCSAPCTGYISALMYQQSIRDAVRFLQGKSQQMIDELTERMEKAAAGLDFEEAAKVRDQIKQLRLVQEQQGVLKKRGDVDVIVIHASLEMALIHCATVREGQVLSSSSFFPSVPTRLFLDHKDVQDRLWQEIFERFIAYYYFDMPERIPAVILTDKSVLDHQALQETLSHLSGKACRIKTGGRGVNARWLDFARNNLQLAISLRTKSEAYLRERYHALCTLLGLSSAIKRMECFDISHTQGKETVASCVVFDEKGPCKKEYRRFNIEDITPGDDYAAIKQALTRRFQRLSTASVLPDVLIIDGGKGQVSVANEVLATLNIHGIKLLGIAKGPSRKAGWERVILTEPAKERLPSPATWKEGAHSVDEELFGPSQRGQVTLKEITLPEDHGALLLLQQIRDEAHRFAIRSHRSRREKAGLHSSLEMIEGIGAKRRQALLQRFGGLRELAKASIEEIAKVRGISAELAERIYHHFHD